MDIKDKIKLSQNIAIISGIFCITVALLLLLNFFQMSKNDPIDSKVLEVLVERLKQEPDNDGLKTEIRNFDLLARKAYFNSQWQVKTGAYLLLFGAIVLAFALRVYYSAKSKIEQPDAVLENEIASRILAQKGIVIVGAVVLVLAFGASFLTVNHLNFYGTGNDMTEVALTDQGIVVIEVGENPISSVAESDLTETDEIQNGEAGSEISAVSSTEKAAAITVNFPADIRKYHNSFRGPFSQGVNFSKNIPTKWDGAAGTNVLWKVPVPKKGYNSPIVWGDKIFLAGADDNSREVYCFNRADGKLLWTGKADNIQGTPASMPKVTEDTGLAAPSLTTDGKYVFAIFATGDVIAFDMDGKRVWARNLGVPSNHYGHSSSLLTWANKLLIQYDTSKGSKVMALSTTNGNTVWETVRNVKVSWASPVLAEVDGKYQVILTADPIVAGYDVETGKELWTVDCMMGEVGPSVAYSNGIAVATNEYARMAAIDVRTGKTLWEDDEYLPEASSPVAYNGLLFVATSYGVLVCYDLRTGEQYWEHDFGTTVYPSPMVADGKLFLMDNNGIMRVYEASKTMKLISENNLGEKSEQTPAFTDGFIYIRGENNLYCIGK
jgi:outer membrane protein assembly factor BamB